MKKTITSAFAAPMVLFAVVACAQATDDSNDVNEEEATDDAAKKAEPASSEEPKKTKQQEELDATIEVMRAQGMSEEQIEQFRQTMQVLVDKTPSEEERKKAREERSAKRAEEDFERRYGDAPKISIKLGPDSYKLSRTVCRNEPEDFYVAGSSKEGGVTMTFSYTYKRLSDTLINSILRLNIGDRDVRLMEDTSPPWSYSQGAYWFAGEVDVRALFGPTSNRQQSIEKMRLTIKAPC